MSRTKVVLIYFLSVHSEHEHGQEIETVGPWPIGHVQPSPTKRIGSISPFSHRLTKVARKLAAGRLTPDANGVGHTATPDTTPHGHASGANPHSRAGDSAKAKEIWITGKKNASVDFFFLFFLSKPRSISASSWGKYGVVEWNHGNSLTAV